MGFWGVVKGGSWWGLQLDWRWFEWGEEMAEEVGSIGVWGYRFDAFSVFVAVCRLDLHF